MNTKLDSVADDNISRCKWLCFQALVPQADPAPTQLHCTTRNLPITFTRDLQYFNLN